MSERTSSQRRTASPPAPSGAGSPARSAGSFWDALDAPQRRALRTVARTRTYNAKAPLCYQGEQSDHIIVIESGWAKVVALAETGQEVVLAVRGPGELICESAALGSRQRSATISALSPLRALVVPAARFTAFLDAHPEAWRMVSTTFVQRLDEGGRRAQAHVSVKGAQRLALLLITLAELSVRHTPPAPDGSIDIAPPLSQEELGSCMDSSRETVARALNHLRRRGLVSTGWRRTTVVDLEGLRSFAAGRPPRE
ncbi:Crp/Fnr family transcriptional regulator [Actinomadura parmotrematis]|uniref:Crp/Fnr family transcriptional regulator n=1 Tax=Actinomadura parmotrematis TaxID=2864039 RepID=UPI0027E24F84|nr:Crp/Fnr family transcriptional regulator [Actinomadura parmotrematis]